MKKDRATLSFGPGDGMGTLRVAVTRDDDQKMLGRIRYHPDSIASCEAMEMELAAIAQRYNVELFEE